MSSTIRIRMTPPPAQGFSLVELMIAVVIGLLGILVIMSVFLVSEGQKRTTTGGADASENALIALTTVERDMRIGGLGLVGLGCTTVNGYNANLGGNFSFAPLPVTITQNSPAAGSDRLAIVYSASAFGNLPTTLTGPMASSADVLSAANGDGFSQNDLILISEAPKDCSLIQASADGARVGSNWTIAHDPGGTALFNPPVATNIFPAGGYAIGARVTNMGAIVRREYFVQGTSLMMRDVNLADSAAPPLNPIPVVEGMIAVRAQYGRDTSVPPDGYIDVYDSTPPASAAELVTIRIAVVSRSGQLEKTAVSPATLTLWNGGDIANGGAIALDATAQLYRYKVYQTTIALRNVIWTNN